MAVSPPGHRARVVADGVYYPDTYAAGVYDRLSDEVAGHVVENESMVKLPNCAGGGGARRGRPGAAP